MSNPVTALKGVSFSGSAKIEEMNLRGMITLRGDLSAPKLKKAAKAATGVDMPSPRGCNVAGDSGLAWMSPDEMLIMVPYADVAKILSQISKSLKDMHHLVCDVSDARTIFRVSGPAAREVLAKLAPVDLHPDSFQPGELRRTRLAQVAAAFWMCDAETFDVICFRSVADYVFGLLKTSAQPGAESDLFQGV